MCEQAQRDELLWTACTKMVCTAALVLGGQCLGSSPFALNVSCSLHTVYFAPLLERGFASGLNHQNIFVRSACVMEQQDDGRHCHHCSKLQTHGVFVCLHTVLRYNPENSDRLSRCTSGVLQRNRRFQMFLVRRALIRRLVAWTLVGTI